MQDKKLDIKSIQAQSNKLRDFRADIQTRKPSHLSRWAYPEATPNTHQTWRDMQEEGRAQQLMARVKRNFIETILLAATIIAFVVVVKGYWWAA
jgi:hypothetical protein